MENKRIKGVYYDVLNILFLKLCFLNYLSFLKLEISINMENNFVF